MTNEREAMLDSLARVYWIYLERLDYFANMDKNPEWITARRLFIDSDLLLIENVKLMLTLEGVHEIKKTECGLELTLKDIMGFKTTRTYNFKE